MNAVEAIPHLIAAFKQIPSPAAWADLQSITQRLDAFMPRAHDVFELLHFLMATALQSASMTTKGHASIKTA